MQVIPAMCDDMHLKQSFSVMNLSDCGATLHKLIFKIDKDNEDHFFRCTLLLLAEKAAVKIGKESLLRARASFDPLLS